MRFKKKENVKYLIWKLRLVVITLVGSFAFGSLVASDDPLSLTAFGENFRVSFLSNQIFVAGQNFFYLFSGHLGAFEFHVCSPLNVSETLMRACGLTSLLTLIFEYVSVEVILFPPRWSSSPLLLHYPLYQSLPGFVSTSSVKPCLSLPHLRTMIGFVSFFSSSTFWPFWSAMKWVVGQHMI